MCVPNSCSGLIPLGASMGAASVRDVCISLLVTDSTYAERSHAQGRDQHPMIVRKITGLLTSFVAAPYNPTDTMRAASVDMQEKTANRMRWPG